MTVDASYQPGVVQIRQTGDLCAVSGTSIVVESGGGLRVESGGAGTVDSGGSLTIASGGSLTVAGSLYSSKVTSASTTAALVGDGLITFSTTGANPGFTMTAPANVGQRVVFSVIDHGATTTSKVITLTGHKVLGGSTVLAGTSVITLTSFLAHLTLVCHSTPNWVVENVSATDVAFA